MILRKSVIISFLIMLCLILLNILYKGNTSSANLISYSDKNTSSIQIQEEYHRPLSSTVFSIPEWWLVFSSEEYADLLKQNVSSDYPYYDSILQYWQTYHRIVDITEAKGFHDSGEILMLLCYWL